MRLEKAPEGQFVVLDAATYNALAAARNEWDSLVVAPAEAGLLLRGEARSVLDLSRLVALAKLGGSGGDHPFKVIAAPAGGVAKVRVLPGAANNIMATVGGAANNPPTWPTLTITESGMVYVKTTWTGTEPRTLDAADVLFAATVPADTDDYGHQLLAQITYTAPVAPATVGTLAIYPAVTHSLFCERFKCSANARYYWNGV